MDYKIILLSLIIAGNVYANTEYVNSDCANNGNGDASSCAASAGATGAFNSINNAVAAYSGVTLTENLTINCRGDTALATTNIASITTSADYWIYLTVDSSSRHAGVWDDSKFTLDCGDDNNCIRASVPYLSIDGFQIYSHCSTGETCHGIRTGTSVAGGYIIKNNIVKYYNATPVNMEGISISDTLENGAYYIVNNIVYGWYDDIVVVMKVNDLAVVYNNTAINATNRGIVFSAYSADDSAYIYNNILGATNNDFTISSSFTTYFHDNNITFDATSPDADHQSKTITFVSETDFHLDASETDAIDLGTDLSTSEQYPFDYDIDGQTRSSTWDIGADETVSVVTRFFRMLMGMGK